jgi:hypothetical protein
MTQWKPDWSILADQRCDERLEGQQSILQPEAPISAHGGLDDVGSTTYIRTGFLLLKSEVVASVESKS